MLLLFFLSSSSSSPWSIRLWLHVPISHRKYHFSSDAYIFGNRVNQWPEIFTKVFSPPHSFLAGLLRSYQFTLAKTIIIPIGHRDAFRGYKRLLLLIRGPRRMKIANETTVNSNQTIKSQSFPSALFDGRLLMMMVRKNIQTPSDCVEISAIIFYFHW